MKTTESFLPIFPGTYGTIFEDIDWDQKDEIGKTLVGVINDYICDLGITAEYQELISPRFYNFSNDSINVVYNYNSLDTFIDWIVENRESVEKELKERYTSCDGFISYHSTDIEEWIEDLETDSHKIGAMLGIYVMIERDYYEVEMEMYDKLSSNGMIVYEDEE